MLKLLSVCITLFAALPAHADRLVTGYVPEAEVVGKGRLTIAFWDVYDAKLWAPNGAWDQQKPFALSLTYLREIDGEDIADRSAEEIRQLGFDDEVKLAAWHSQMRTIFPDVKEGSTLTGIYVPNQPTKFYDGARQVGVINDPLFGEWFFNIWLSEDTSEPSLRNQLLGV